MYRGKRVLLIIGLLLLLSYKSANILFPSQAGIQHSYINSSLSLIVEPEQGITPILSAIAAATSSVDMVMYQLEDTQVQKALVQDAARGVAVRVLLNKGYYGAQENDKNVPAYQYLSSNGVSVHWTPAHFALTHQKTIVIDRHRAYIMTLNLTPQYYASGREFAIVDTDTLDVSAIESTFDSDWNDAPGAAARGNDLVWSPGSETVLLSLINNATSTLDIYNEEMADTPIINALEDAARRGVVVRVDMTYSKSWKKALTALSTAGVQVHTYAASAPLYIHAKVVIADGAQAFVGSENFSSNSLKKNRELGLIIESPVVIDQLQKVFEKDWSGASLF